jgi:uncharacterized protein YbaR (Trm112 family)
MFCPAFITDRRNFSMHSFLLEMFACPACYGTLKWEILEQRDDRIEAAEALCTACTAAYPVREGIGLFLTPDLPRNDLWEQSGKQVELTDICKGQAKPTPASLLIEGLGIDGLPVSDTVLEWGVLVAR